MALAALGPAVLLAAGCGVSPPPSTSPLASPWAATHFAEAGLTFDYPAAWTVHHFEMTSSFSSAIAWLGDVPMKDPCTRTPDSVSCAAGYSLAPGTVMVLLETASFPGFDILSVPAGARPITIDGLPGFAGDADPADGTGATAARTWSIPRPGSIDNYYLITASVRAPDEAALLEVVDRMVLSIRYATPVPPLPTDPAAAVEAGSAALAAAAMGSDPSWGCFPPPGETRTMTVSSLPNGPRLTEPQAATCTTSIEPTAMQLWRMTLEMRLAAPDASAGQGVRMTMYVDSTGEAVGGGMSEDISP